MIRVLIADDHDIVRTGLHRILEELPDMAVCGEARNGDETLRLARSERPDVAVLDVNMPGSQGPSLVTALRGASPATQVVLFTMFSEDSHAVGFLRAGASAFINKRRSSEELIRAIRWAAQGRRYITPELADYLFTHQIDLQKAPRDLLSGRELEVIRGLADGLRATEIAARLELSASTVNTFVQRIKAKLGVRTAVEIVEVARGSGLLG